MGTAPPGPTGGRRANRRSPGKAPGTGGGPGSFAAPGGGAMGGGAPAGGAGGGPSGGGGGASGGAAPRRTPSAPRTAAAWSFGFRIRLALFSRPERALPTSMPPTRDVSSRHARGYADAAASPQRL